MTAALLLAAFLVQPVTTPTAPPAPPAAPPRIMTAPPPIVTAGQDAIAPGILDIRITTEEGLLWQGSLRIGRGGASFSQERREARETPCTGNAYDVGQQTGFSLNVLRTYAAEYQSVPSYQVSVRWTRPTSPDSCTVQGSRSVQLEQRVLLAEGGSAVLRGDGGLVVNIRRR